MCLEVGKGNLGHKSISILFKSNICKGRVLADSTANFNGYLYLKKAPPNVKWDIKVAKLCFCVECGSPCNFLFRDCGEEQISFEATVSFERFSPAAQYLCLKVRGCVISGYVIKPALLCLLRCKHFTRCRLWNWLINNWEGKVAALASSIGCVGMFPSFTYAYML